MPKVSHFEPIPEPKFFWSKFKTNLYRSESIETGHDGFPSPLRSPKVIRMAPTYTGDNSDPQLWVTVQIIHLNVIHWQKSKVPEIIDQTAILCEVWDQNRHQPTFQSSSKMVLLNVKHLNNSIFLVETTLTASVDETLAQIIKLHNGILKVQLCF